VSHGATRETGRCRNLRQSEKDAAMDGAGIEQGRRAYFDEGQLPLESVRQPVLRSWLRCTDMGLSQGRRRDGGPLNESELGALRQRRESRRATRAAS